VQLIWLLLRHLLCPLAAGILSTAAAWCTHRVSLWGAVLFVHQHLVSIIISETWEGASASAAPTPPTTPPAPAAPGHGCYGRLSRMCCLWCCRRWWT
jgi:hypothetical protein